MKQHSSQFEITWAKKFSLLLVLLVLSLLTLCSCGSNKTVDPAKITSDNFTEGNHPRDEEYAASFQTKSVALDGMNIHFAETIFDETDSPELAKQIAADYAALAELDDSLAQPVDIYLVSETTTGHTVVTTSGLFCTPESVQDGTYRPFLTSCTFNLTPWWQCVGLSRTAFEEPAVSSDELADRLESYYANAEKPYLLTLSPLYFIEDFADTDTKDLAAQSAQSLTAYILSQNDVKSFLTDENTLDYRSEWLKELGVTVDTERISSPEAVHLSSVPMISDHKAPLIIEEHNFLLNLKSVDWMPTADDASFFVVDFYQSVKKLFSYLKENAPKHYETLQQPDYRQISVIILDDDARSYATPDGREAIVSAQKDALHEFTHCVIPAIDATEKRWLCEGLTTYLSAPFISYEAAPELVDPFANEDEIAKLPQKYLEPIEKIAARYKQVTGHDISEVYQTETPFYLICQAIGYEATFHPETFKDISLPMASMSVDKRVGVSSGYVGNQLSYVQSLVYVQYLVDKYGLDTIIEAEMDNNAYRELFPDAAAFQAGYDAFVAQIEFE